MINFFEKYIHSIRFGKKLNFKYYNLYKMLKQIKTQIYRLKFFVNMKKIYNVFHVSFLKSYKKKI